jgi:hypothetical protein
MGSQADHRWRTNMAQVRYDWHAGNKAIIDKITHNISYLLLSTAVRTNFYLDNCIEGTHCCNSVADTFILLTTKSAPTTVRM